MFAIIFSFAFAFWFLILYFSRDGEIIGLTWCTGGLMIQISTSDCRHKTFRIEFFLEKKYYNLQDPTSNQVRYWLLVTTLRKHSIQFFLKERKTINSTKHSTDQRNTKEMLYFRNLKHNYKNNFWEKIFLSVNSALDCLLPVLHSFFQLRQIQCTFFDTNLKMLIIWFDY